MSSRALESILGKKLYSFSENLILYQFLNLIKFNRALPDICIRYNFFASKKYLRETRWHTRRFTDSWIYPTYFRYTSASLRAINSLSIRTEWPDNNQILQYNLFFFFWSVKIYRESQHLVKKFPSKNLWYVLGISYIVNSDEIWNAFKSFQILKIKKKIRIIVNPILKSKDSWKSWLFWKALTDLRIARWFLSLIRF